MNVSAISLRSNARFGLAMSPAMALGAGFTYKASSAAFRVADMAAADSSSDRKLTKDSAKQNTFLVSLMTGMQATLEYAKHKLPLDRFVSSISPGRLATTAKAAVLVGPFLAANIFSEWASRKFSNFNQSLNNAISGNGEKAKPAKSVSKVSLGGFWNKRNNTADAAAFEARLHSAPWTVSPQRQVVSLVPRY